VDALAHEGDEGRVTLRKVSGSCEKALIRKCPNGGTHRLTVSCTEYIGAGSKPRELKYLSTWRKGNQRDSLSSDERTGTRPVALL
jgi:hypothetical protein